jgi:hypothetical protein
LLKIKKQQAIKGFDSSIVLQLEKIVWLDVMSTSPALLFYKKMGFNTVSFYALDYPDLKDEHREMQRMVLFL